MNATFIGGSLNVLQQIMPLLKIFHAKRCEPDEEANIEMPKELALLYLYSTILDKDEKMEKACEPSLEVYCYLR